MAYKPYNHALLRSDLIRHEGKRSFPYLDSVGKTTIGIGHNLDDLGLSDEQIASLLSGDIDIAEQALDNITLDWRFFSEDRKLVILNMAFNLGETRLRTFRKMWAALGQKDWDEAANQMVDSKWYGQVGKRAVELVSRMRNG